MSYPKDDEVLDLFESIQIPWAGNKLNKKDLVVIKDLFGSDIDEFKTFTILLREGIKLPPVHDGMQLSRLSELGLVVRYGRFVGEDYQWDSFFIPWVQVSHIQLSEIGF